MAQLEGQLGATKEGMEADVRAAAADAAALRAQAEALRGRAAPSAAESEASLAALQVWQPRALHLGFLSL